MGKSKNQRTTFLLITLLALLIVAYKVLFVVPAEIEEVDPVSVVRIETTINQLSSVDLSSSAINDPKFNNLKDITQPFVSVPVGRTNPFSSF